MKRLLNFIIGKLFKIPRANLDNIYPPVSCDITSLSLETLRAEIFIHNDNTNVPIPESVYKKEVARVLSNSLIPYIKLESCDNLYRDGVVYRGTIRVVKER